MVRAGWALAFTAVVVVALIVVGVILHTHTPGGSYVIRAATLQGGISTLDLIEAENLTAKYGYPLKVERFQETPEIIAAIAKGEADLAVVPAEMAAKLIETQGGVVIVAAEMLQNQAIIAKDNSIKSPLDLKGKLVGAVIASGTYKLFKAYMEVVYGVPVVEGEKPAPDRVTVVNVPPGSILDALSTGSVDAAVIWEPIVSEGIARGFHVVAPFTQLWRDAESKTNVTGSPIMLVWIAREDFVKQHPDALRAFLKAREDAVRIWRSNPDLVFHVLSRLYHIDRGTFNILYKRVALTSGPLDEDMVKSIYSEWWLAWRGGYLPKPPSSIGRSVFYWG